MAEEKEIGSLSVKIGLDGTGFQAGVGAINKQLAVVKSELALATAKIGDFGKGTDGLRAKADSLSKQMELQNQKVTALNGAFDKSVDTKGRDAKATQDLEIKLNNAKTAMANMENELRLTNTRLSEGVPQANKLGEALSEMSTKLKSVGQNMQQAGRSLSIGVTAPIVAVGYEAGKASVDFETAFAGVKKTINASAEEFAKLRTGVRQMAQDMPATAEAIATVEASAGQLGIHNENIESFTKVMINLGVATNLTADQAATDLARIANITQMPQTQFEKLGSTIVALGNNMATTEAEIVAMDLRLAGAGSQIGLTNAQTLGFSAALSSVGIEAEAGGSSVSKVMIKIANAVAGGGKEMDKLAKVSGMTGAQFKKSFQTDAAGAIVTFIEGLGKMEKSGQNVFAVLDDLGLSETRTRDALLRASGAGDLFRKSLDIANKGWEQNIALQKEVDQRYGTTASQLQIMKNRLHDVGITLGDALIPAFMKALDAAKPLFELIKNGADWFAHLNTPMQETILALFGIAAASGPALIGIGLLTSGVGALAGAFAILTGPVGLAAAGIAVVAATGVALEVAIQKTGTGIKNFIYMMLESLGPIGQAGIAILELANAAIHLATHWDAARVTMKKVLDIIAYDFISSMNTIKQLALEAAYYVVDKLSMIADYIPGFSSKVKAWKKELSDAMDMTKETQSLRDLSHAVTQNDYNWQLQTIALGKVKQTQDDVVETAHSVTKEFGLQTTAVKEVGDAVVETTDKMSPFDRAMKDADFNLKMGNITLAQYAAQLQNIKSHLVTTTDEFQTVSLAIKDANDKITQNAQEALKAQFEFSKQWIADKKELNELSATEEIAAWKRVADQYKDGSTEKIEADKNYYKLKNVLDAKNAADKIESDKKTRETAIAETDKLGEAIVNALRSQYAAEEKIEIDANDKSVSNAKDASDQRMNIIQQEHDNKIKLLDDTSNAEIASIQTAIDAIDAQTKAEDGALKQQDFEAKRIELEQKVASISNADAIAAAKQKLIDATSQKEFRAIDAKAEYEQSIQNAGSPDAKLKAQQILNQKLLGLDQDVATAQTQLNVQTTKEATDKAAVQKGLADLVAAHDRQAILDSRQAQKDALKAQIDALKANVDASKQAIDDELKTKQLAETNSLKATTERLSGEKTAIEQHYIELNKEEAIQAKARTLALDTNNKDLITLLGSYNPQWQNAGQSFGESLLNGLNSTKENIQTAVNDILSLVNKSKTIEVGKNVTQGLATGVGAALPALKQSSGGVIGAMVDVFKNTLGIRSPSRVMMEIGNFTGQGMVLGLQGTINNIRQQARLLATAAIPQTNSAGGVALAGGSSGGGGGQQNHYTFAPGSVVINAKDLKEMQDITDFFKRLPQANRAR